MITQIRNIALAAFKNEGRAIEACQWYQDAGRYCAGLDRDFSLSSGTAAGVIAALSPLNSWPIQVRDTPAIIASFQAGNNRLPGIGFFRNKDKAVRILQGEAPLDVLGGDKVRAFYRNLTGDEEAVTIDRHAIAISGFSSPAADNWGKLHSPQYKRISFAFSAAAQDLGLTPASIQALTWTYWREAKAGRDW